jgi:hypothetical protein
MTIGSGWKVLDREYWLLLVELQWPVRAVAIWCFISGAAKFAVLLAVKKRPPNFRKILGDWVAKCDVLLALIGSGWWNRVDIHEHMLGGQYLAERRAPAVRSRRTGADLAPLPPPRRGALSPVRVTAGPSAAVLARRCVLVPTLGRHDHRLGREHQWWWWRIHALRWQHRRDLHVAEHNVIADNAACLPPRRDPRRNFVGDCGGLILCRRMTGKRPSDAQDRSKCCGFPWDSHRVRYS